MSTPTDKETAATARVISRLLSSGVSASLVLVSLGTVLGFLQRSDWSAAASTVASLTGSGGQFPRSASWLASGIVHLDGRALIILGLVFLIATPIVRVAVSVATFARDKDRTFALITSLVLALLLLSLALGKAG